MQLHFQRSELKLSSLEKTKLLTLNVIPDMYEDISYRLKILSWDLPTKSFIKLLNTYICLHNPFHRV